MPFLDGVTGRVYYRHWATESPSAALIFLHGFGEHSGLYHRYAHALGARGIDVWALDEIGHGLTEGDRGRFGSLADLAVNATRLTDLAARTSPGLPLVISGHSLGSLVAVGLALDSPERYRSVVVSGAALSPLPWLTEAVADADGGEFSLDPAALSSDPFYLDELENDPLAFTSADVGDRLAEAFPPVWERLARDLPGLTLPLLAVHGEADQVAPIDGVRAWTGRVPGLRLEEIAGAGHDVLNETQHRRIAETIAGFIGETTRETAA